MMEFDIREGSLKKASGGDERVSVPAGVTSIAEGVFSSFSDMKSVSLPESLTAIGDHAFNNCFALEMVEMPKSVKRIGEYSFQYCRSMKHLSLPEGLERIPCSAFRYCESLKEINLPASVKSVEYDAFFGCRSLEAVIALSEECDFGRHAFNGCDALKRVDAPASALCRLDAFQLARASVYYCLAADTFRPASRGGLDALLEEPSRELIALICENDDAASLHYALSSDIMSEKGSARFLQAAREKKAYKCLSALMEYRNRRFFSDGINDMMKELEL